MPDQQAQPSAGQTAAAGSERRTQPRRNIDSVSVLFFDPGSRSVDCVVRNISRTGARVVLSEQVDLSPAIQIHVAPGAYRNALVRWRIGLEIGLEFVG